MLRALRNDHPDRREDDGFLWVCPQVICSRQYCVCQQLSERGTCVPDRAGVSQVCLRCVLLVTQLQQRNMPAVSQTSTLYPLSEITVQELSLGQNLLKSTNMSHLVTNMYILGTNIQPSGVNKVHCNYTYYFIHHNLVSFFSLFSSFCSLEKHAH